MTDREKFLAHVSRIVDSERAGHRIEAGCAVMTAYDALAAENARLRDALAELTESASDVPNAPIMLVRDIETARDLLTPTTEEPDHAA